MKAEITVLQGKRKGEVFVIQNNQRLLFGRDLACDVQLYDDGVSRQHFVVEGRGNSFVLSDINSANGTFVNGAGTTTKVLRSGDVLRAGNCWFSFHYVGAPVKEFLSNVTISDESTSFMRMTSSVSKKFSIDSLSTTVKGSAEAEKYLNSLKALYEIGNAIHMQQDLGALFHAIMDQALSVVPADRAYLVMYHPNDDTFETVVVRRTDTTRPDSTLNLSKTVLYETVKKGNAVLSSDLANDLRFKTGESIMLQDIRSVVCVPVATPQQTLGAIYLDNLGGAGDNKRVFTEFELELVAAIGRQAGIAIHRAKLFEDIEELFYGTIRALVATIEAKDSYTHGHSERVTEFSMAIAEAMGLSPQELDTIRLAAILHDIGKIAIPERVLNKPSRLTEQEFLLIKNHPVYGAEILRHISNIEPVILGVLHHHEKWNGTGYPNGLAGEDIPLQARIIAVADAFDAMTSNRPYRSNFAIEQVIREFQRCSDDHFDGRVVAPFIKLLESGRIKPHYKEAEGATATA